MGFLDRLRGGSTQTTLQAVEFPEGETVAIVGEASYQPAIANACGSTKWEDVRCEISQIAVVPEPGNQYDQNAVAIFIGGEKVGYRSPGRTSLLKCAGLSATRARAKPLP